MYLNGDVLFPPELLRRLTYAPIYYLPNGVDLAAGFMVVSRPMAEYSNFSPCIRLKVGKEGFTESVLDYLKDPAQDEELRDKLNNLDWRNLAAQIKEIISSSRWTDVTQ